MIVGRMPTPVVRETQPKIIMPVIEPGAGLIMSHRNHHSPIGYQASKKENTTVQPPPGFHPDKIMDPDDSGNDTKERLSLEHVFPPGHIIAHAKLKETCLQVTFRRSTCFITQDYTGIDKDPGA